MRLCKKKILKPTFISYYFIHFILFFSNLKSLLLYDLPEVKDIENSIKTLNKDLPQCEIKYYSTEEMEEMKREQEAKDAPDG